MNRKSYFGLTALLALASSACANDGGENASEDGSKIERSNDNAPKVEVNFNVMLDVIVLGVSLRTAGYAEDPRGEALPGAGGRIPEGHNVLTLLLETGDTIVLDISETGECTTKNEVTWISNPYAESAKFPSSLYKNVPGECGFDVYSIAKENGSSLIGTFSHDVVNAQGDRENLFVQFQVPKTDAKLMFGTPDPQ